MKSGALPVFWVEQDKLFVTCPDCEQKYSFQTARLAPRGSSFVCRVCGTRVTMPDKEQVAPATSAAIPATLGARQGAGSSPAPILPASPSDAAPARAGPGRTGAGAPSATGRDAVGLDRETLGPARLTCPHCGRDFIPSRPAGSRPSSSSVGGGAQRPAERQPTILVVEDTEFFRELAKETLSRDYRTILAATASDALGALAAERVDLVVLDLALEAEDDGLPVLDAASRRGIPVLVFTASDDSDLQYGRGWGSLRARGASDLLVKAMNVEDRLREKVAALVGPGAG